MNRHVRTAVIVRQVLSGLRGKYTGRGGIFQRYAALTAAAALVLLCPLHVSAGTLGIDASKIRSVRITTEFPYISGFKLNMIINASRDEIKAVTDFMNSFELADCDETDTKNAPGAGKAVYNIEFDRYDGGTEEYSCALDSLTVYYTKIIGPYRSYRIVNKLPWETDNFFRELYAGHAEPSGWAEEDIEKALYAGIVPENVKNNYTQYITRGEFCETAADMLANVHRKIGISVSERDLIQCPFDDVDNRKLDLLYTYDIIGGSEDSSFMPEEFVSEEEIIAVLGRIADRFCIKLPFSGFSDSGYIKRLNLSPPSDMYFGKVIALDAEFGSNPNIDFKAPAPAEKAISMTVRMMDAIRGQSFGNGYDCEIKGITLLSPKGPELDKIPRDIDFTVSAELEEHSPEITGCYLLEAVYDTSGALINTDLVKIGARNRYNFSVTQNGNIGKVKLFVVGKTGGGSPSKDCVEIHGKGIKR